MKLKRFIAPDMRQALRLVREEQGPDAVILSNQRVDSGIEIIAAVDYDPVLARHMLGDQKTATPGVAVSKSATETPPLASPAQTAATSVIDSTQTATPGTNATAPPPTETATPGVAVMTGLQREVA